MLPFSGSAVAYLESVTSDKRKGGYNMGLFDKLKSGFSRYDDEYDDDEVDAHSGNTKNIRRSRKSSKEDDDYEVDFIDL